MGTIRNFGHFWDASKVHWNLGGKGPKGHLKGHHGRGRHRITIDFRAQMGVYVLFAPNREVIYVGQVGSGDRRRLFGRLKQHTKNHLRGRWTHFSWFGLCDVDPATHGLKAFQPTSEGVVDVLNELEAVLIHLFEPRLNMQRAKWTSTTEFTQYLPGDEDEEEEEEREDAREN
jgi:hypothetical protein